MTNHALVRKYTSDITREEWLELRKEGIGGSDAGIILKVNKWRTQYDLWADKRGLIPEQESNAAMEWGNDLELVVAQRYAKTYQKAVVAIPALLQSAERSWQLANVDFFIANESAGYPVGEVTPISLSEKTDFTGIHEGNRHVFEAILEIKTAGIASRANLTEWENGGVPQTYHWQVVHYSAVTGIRKAVIAALIGGQGLVVRDIEIENSEVEFLNQVEEDFWQLVTTGVEPELEGRESELNTLKSLYPVSFEKTVEVDEFAKDLVAEYQSLKAQQDELEEKLTRVKGQLIQLAGDADTVTYQDEVLFTYKSSKVGEAFDAKALKAAEPETYARFVKEKAGFRTLRVKGGN